MGVVDIESAVYPITQSLITASVANGCRPLIFA